MDATVRFARRHLGLAWPNPSVGALIVRFEPEGPRVVGRGVTARGGRPHAERQAIAAAGALARGATLYVTLEPCAHHGKTPPCAEAVVEAGIARVVTAMEDPDSRVAGKGHAYLRRHGVEVVLGVGRAEAERGMAGFLTRMRRGRPRVTLKLAVSADGMIGKDGVPNFAVSCEAARGLVHVMRAEADAIAVGGATAAIDDPMLDVRLPGMADTSPVRVVFDTRGRLALESRLVQSARQVPVVWVTTTGAGRTRIEQMHAAGVDPLLVPTAPDGHLDLIQALNSLSWKGIGGLLVEGGAVFGEALMARDLVDEISILRSPVVVGARGVPAPAGLRPVLEGRDDRFTLESRRAIGTDEHIRYRRLGR